MIQSSHRQDSNLERLKQCRSNHGQLLHRAAELAEQHQLKPLLAQEQFGQNDISRAYDAVAKGSKGKVVLEL
jgi:NADPH2:quinone reductase